MVTMASKIKKSVESHIANSLFCQNLPIKLPRVVFFLLRQILPCSELYPVISCYAIRDSFHKEVKDALLIVICSLQYSLIKFTLS